MKTAQRVNETISDLSDYRDFNASSSLESDLGFDSLDIVELTMALEEKFGIEIRDDHAEAWRTVRNVIDYILTRRPDDEESVNS